jgi:hypothetical protein
MRKKCYNTEDGKEKRTEGQSHERGDRKEGREGKKKRRKRRKG